MQANSRLNAERGRGATVSLTVNPWQRGFTLPPGYYLEKTHAYSHGAAGWEKKPYVPTDVIKAKNYLFTLGIHGEFVSISRQLVWYLTGGVCQARLMALCVMSLPCRSVQWGLWNRSRLCLFGGRPGGDDEAVCCFFFTRSHFSLMWCEYSLSYKGNDVVVVFLLHLWIEEGPCNLPCYYMALFRWIHYDRYWFSDMFYLLNGYPPPISSSKAVEDSIRHLPCKIMHFVRRVRSVQPTLLC